MKQKLIFLDIDGTLLPPGEMTVPDSAVEALRRARANGHKLFLCTGRNLRMTEPLFHYGFDGFVCSAGGYVGCEGKVLVDLPMEPEQVRGLRAALQACGAECTLEVRDDTYGGIKMIERFANLFPKKPGQTNSEAERWRKMMEFGMTIRPIEEYHGEPVYKIVFIAPNEACLTEVKRQYEDQFVFCESPPWRRGRWHRERRTHQPKIQQGQRHPGHLQLPGLLAGRYHRLWRQRQRLADDGRCRHQRLHGQRLR